MNREDFKIDGIPESYRVYDVDLTSSGRPVVGIAHLHDQTAPAFIVTGTGSSVVIPDDLLWPRRDGIGKPRVQAAGEGLVVAQRRRARHDAERTAWIWTGDGQFVSSFAGGDDCEELLANGDHLLLFYGDEAGGGMCVYSTEGVRMWSQAEQFPKERILWWFHAPAWAAPDEAAIWADVQREGAELSCAYVRLNVRERSQRLWHPPLPIATPTAVTTIGERVILHGTGADAEGRRFLESFSNDVKVQEMKQRLEAGGLGEALSRQLVEPFINDPKAREMLASNLTPDGIVEWRPGESTWRVIGEWPARQLRGLPGGRFIAVQPDGYTILSFD